jgi:cytochrome c peroxidase
MRALAHTLILAAALTSASATAQVQVTYFPAPKANSANPTTPAKALLGKALFWDEQLSSSRTMACGTCHVFGSGGSDPRSTRATHPGYDGVFGTADDIHGSPGVVQQDAFGNYTGSPTFGIRPQSTGRRAPSVINAAYENELFWDGRAGSTFTDPATNTILFTTYGALESQIAGPPVSDVEMSHMGRSWNDIALDLTNRTPLALAENIPANLATFIAGQTYASLFQQVYGSPGVTPQRIIFAIAAYERTLVSDQTRYDAYLAGSGNLTTQEARGLSLVFQFCMICHLDLLPNTHQFGPALNDFRQIGVRPEFEDVGRFAVTSNQFELGMFRVPQLRNVALRAPYMHNGGQADLNAVMNFYNRGGDFGSNIDPNVQFMAGQLTSQDNIDLIAFMQTLTDLRVQNELPPFDRPRLWSESTRAPQMFGTGTVGTGGKAPAARIDTPAFLGNGKFTLSLDDAKAFAPVFLLLDVAGSTTGVPLYGQNYYLSPSANVQFLGLTKPSSPTSSLGYFTNRFPMPTSPAFGGLQLWSQWLVFDVLGPNGITSSNGARVTLF